MTPPPSPEAQLAFLSKLQRLFAEGDFTATYKFALLIALADLAVERGRDDGERCGCPTAPSRPSSSSCTGSRLRRTAPGGLGRRLASWRRTTAPRPLSSTPSSSSGSSIRRRRRSRRGP